MKNYSLKPFGKSKAIGAGQVLPLQEVQPVHSHQASSLQSGQAIIFIALIMVALIAILGLAVDGGGLFFLHRDTQNATDAAVIAATYARCVNGDSDVVEFAGYQAAARNGFDNNSTSNWVVVNNPPTSGTGMGESEYVEVTITAAKPSYFIQLVYPDPLQVTSRAVGRCSPPFNPATLPALFGISDHCQNTVDITGSNWSVDSDPAIHSNFDIHVSGSDGTVDGGATAVGTIDTSSSGNTTFDPAAVSDPNSYSDDPLGENFALEEFGPNGRFWEEATIKTEIGPGSDDFNDINGTWSPNGQTLEGLYYVHGDVRINNARIGTGGITIAAEGEIDFSSGANLLYHVGGFLLVSDKTTTCTGDAIHISGSGAQWYGVIYAPNGGASISGSDLNIIGAVIAQTINFSASRTQIVYDPDLLDPIPANVTVSE